MNFLKASALRLRNNERRVFWITSSALIGFRIWLSTGLPMMYGYFPHDDLFYAKAAHYIIHGQWMGPYSQMTLIKEPFYPLFIVAAFATGLPLFLAETLFWLGACAALFYALRPLARSAWWRLFVLAVLLYSPPSLAFDWNLRVQREFVYYSVTLYVVAFAVGLLLRLDRSVGKVLAWAAALGAAMGAFVLTREEAIWIYPAMFGLLLGCVVLIWRKGTDRKWLRSAIAVSPIILWYLPTIAVSWLNYSSYGYWGTTEQLAPDFARVLNTLSRIKSTTWYPFIPITAEARTKAYQASPLFASLEPAIDSQLPNWQPWDDLSTSIKPQWYLQKYGNAGNEIGAHFLWLFRDAVYSTGYYASGRYPQAFYRQLADELVSACRNGKLDCSPPRLIPIIGNVDARDYPIITRMFLDGISHLLVLDPSMPFVTTSAFSISAWPAYDNSFKYFDEFVYNPIEVQQPGPRKTSDLMLGGKTNVSLKMLAVKSSIMRGIVAIYRILTLPLFLLALAVWFALLVMAATRKASGVPAEYLMTSIFLIGLLFSRLVVLAIFDATTSIPATIHYGTSTYVFIYSFSGLMMIAGSRPLAGRPGSRDK